MGKRVALLILVLLVIGGTILWVRSTQKPVLPPAPEPGVTRVPAPTPAATEVPAPTANCPCTEANGDILVNAMMGDLPTTCAHTGTATTLTWRATDNSTLHKKIPDWGTQAPTTPINPYPSATCPSTPGTFCVSGAFAGQDIANCTDIRYSITTTSAGRTKEHFGHVVIVRP